MKAVLHLSCSYEILWHSNKTHSCLTVNYITRLPARRFLFKQCCFADRSRRGAWSEVGEQNLRMIGNFFGLPAEISLLFKVNPAHHCARIGPSPDYRTQLAVPFFYDRIQLLKLVFYLHRKRSPNNF